MAFTHDEAVQSARLLREKYGIEANVRDTNFDKDSGLDNYSYIGIWFGTECIATCDSQNKVDQLLAFARHIVQVEEDMKQEDLADVERIASYTELEFKDWETSKNFI